MTVVLTLFFLWHSTHASQAVLECKYKSRQVDLAFTMYTPENLKLTGRIMDLPFTCDLKLEEVAQLKRSRGPEKFRINTRRMDKDCNPELNMALKKGLEDQVDILIYKKSAKAFLFEEHSPVTCQSFKINEAQLNDLSKLPKKKYRAEYSSRTTRAFDFLNKPASQKVLP